MGPPQPNHELPGRRIPSQRLMPTADSVAAVRRMVCAQLEQAAVAWHDAVVVASELATNAVLHARTPYVVELHVGKVVRIEVTDTGLGAPVLQPSPSNGTSGRGLVLVAALSSRWGVEWLDGSKVVWAEVPR
jgi:anti-sigma regulatory factor (Ser/Thr protein kinase)